ncbi:hypothetical protein ABD91_20790 [Lysinibacillus sphaericus]|uniref:hypothetical protein n=1 Tax=Lysinibacillus sphaericus TaxID=1421 RepID=UPI0018CD8533|nr:hypothetical protein [Lysinibacillus sphaericus]MBG9693180.1 hypothetical protein [Lysinibacillus sphaericus]
MTSKLITEVVEELKIGASKKEVQKRMKDLEKGFLKGLEDFKGFLNEDNTIRHFDAMSIVRELEQPVILPLFKSSENSIAYTYVDYAYKSGIEAALSLMGLSKDKLKEAFNISLENPEKLERIHEQAELIVTDERQFPKHIELEMVVNSGVENNRLFKNGDLLTVLSITELHGFAEINVIDQAGSVHQIYEENLTGVEIHNRFYNTDDQQYCRDLNNEDFEYVEYQQVRSDDDTPKFLVKHDVLNFGDLSEEEINEAISGYYDSLNEVIEMYGSQYKQIVVECLFESSEDNIVVNNAEEAEVVAFLKRIGVQIDELEIDEA